MEWLAVGFGVRLYTGTIWRTCSIQCVRSERKLSAQISQMQNNHPMCVLRNYLRGVKISAFGTNNSKPWSIRLYLELFAVGVSMHTKYKQ